MIWQSTYIRHMSQGNRLGIISDIFLLNWRWQARFVRILDATTNSTETRHSRRDGGWTHGEHAKGARDDRRRLPSYRRSKRDLKISMQIRRIIIPTVRLAPESYGGSLDLGLRHYTVYRIQCYGIWCTDTAGLPSYELRRGRIRIQMDGIQRAAGLLTVSSGRHLTSLNMDYSGDCDCTISRLRYVGS